jgi:FkbM family methyltransferase
VYAFEALPANYEVLLKNLELNGLTNVTPICGVAADRTSEMQVPQKTTRGNYSLATMSAERTSAHAWSLDDFARQYQIDRIDLMVIDIEGSETMALRGARTLLSSGRVGTTVCEVNPGWLRRMGSSPVELYREFEATALTVAVLERFGRSRELTPGEFAELTGGSSGIDKVDVVLRPRSLKNTSAKG